MESTIYGNLFQVRFWHCYISCKNKKLNLQNLVTDPNAILYSTQLHSYTVPILYNTHLYSTC